MKTDVIKVTDALEGQEAAAQAAEKFTAYNNITGKSAMHIRLLTEEMLSMIHGILDDFSGDFWLESEQTKKGLLCRICLSADKQINREQEKKILSVSSSGRNQNAKGIMGRIREMLRTSLQTESSTDEEYLRSMTDAWTNPGSTGDAYWSLQSYCRSLSPKAKTEEWDELEKSIIVKLADEVKVWLKSSVTEVVIEKLLPVG